VNLATSILIPLAVVAAVAALVILMRRAHRLSKEKLMEFLAGGTQIVDVRTPKEYQKGHVNGSLNIPLDELGSRVAELDRDRPVVVCCASGARSSMAKFVLVRAGFTTIHDAGPWQVVASAQRVS